MEHTCLTAIAQVTMELENSAKLTALEQAIIEMLDLHKHKGAYEITDAKHNSNAAQVSIRNA